MTTNATIDPESGLAKRGAELIEAAYAYWKEYRKTIGGPSAVVWLEADNGHFILFTRGEYKDAIMSAANRECAGAEALFKPFEQ